MVTCGQPETHNFDACTEYYSPEPADAVITDGTFPNSDCLSTCMGNDYKGFGGCEAPYYFSLKYNQELSDYIGDVICQTFCTDEVKTIYDDYPDTAQIKIGCYIDYPDDRAMSYSPTANG
jgi:hypothetical protein